LEHKQPDGASFELIHAWLINAPSIAKRPVLSKHNSQNNERRYDATTRSARPVSMASVAGGVLKMLILLEGQGS
jgi:hypothetical protein